MATRSRSRIRLRARSKLDSRSEMTHESCRITDDDYIKHLARLISAPKLSEDDDRFATICSRIRYEMEKYMKSDRDAFELLQDWEPIAILGSGENGVAIEMEFRGIGSDRSTSKKQTANRVAKFSTVKTSECSIQHEFGRAGLAPDVYACESFVLYNTPLWLTWMQKVDGTLETWINQKSRTHSELSAVVKNVIQRIDDCAAEGYTHGDTHWGNVGYFGNPVETPFNIVFLDFGYSTTALPEPPGMDALQLLRFTYRSADEQRQFKQGRNWSTLRSLLQELILERGWITKKQLISNETKIDEQWERRFRAYEQRLRELGQSLPIRPSHVVLPEDSIVEDKSIRLRSRSKSKGRRSRARSRSRSISRSGSRSKSVVDKSSITRSKNRRSKKKQPTRRQPARAAKKRL